jgi:hypothetical protein
MATEVREFPLALQGNAAMGEFELESYGRTGKVFYFMQSRYVRPDGIVRYTQPGDLNVEFL